MPKSKNKHQLYFQLRNILEDYQTMGWDFRWDFRSANIQNKTLVLPYYKQNQFCKIAQKLTLKI